MMNTDTLSYFEYRSDRGGIVITGYHGPEKDIVIPDAIDGEPVVRIAENALRQSSARSISVPESVRTISEWFDPEEDIILKLYGVKFERLMSPRWRELGLEGYIAIRMENGTIGEEISSGYECYIREHFVQFEERLRNDKNMMRCFMKHSLIPISALSSMLDAASGDPELSASLLEYRRENFTGDEITSWEETELGSIMSGHTPGDLLRMWDVERLDNGRYKLKSWHGTGAVIHIPPRIGRIPIGEIGEDCFSPLRHGLSRQEIRNREEIIKVTIPESVTGICSGAFRGCIGLESVNIPVTLTRIEDSAFSGCVSLCVADVPDIPDTIGKSCFLGCRNLADKDGYVIICGHLFDYYGPSEAHIPEGVTHISPRAFEDYTKLRTVTFPQTLQAIEEFAFCGCTGLDKVMIPSGVQRIGRAAFAWCTGIRNVTVKEGTISIGENAFRYCGQLVSAELPGSLNDIGFNILMDTGDLTVTCPAESAIEKYAILYGHRLNVK